MSGSEPYTCRLRGDSSAPNAIIWRVLALRWTTAVAITISFTYTSPGPYRRHIARNGALVTPAIGASTTGAAGVKSPMRSGCIRTTVPVAHSVRAMSELADPVALNADSVALDAADALADSVVERPRYNGADHLIANAVHNGVTVCFANPGTTELHLVAALDANPHIRTVLCPFEGV